MSGITLKEKIRGLELIMEDKVRKGDLFVSREYILEKLKKIRKGIPFLHPSITRILMDEKREQNTEKIREKRSAVNVSMKGTDATIIPAGSQVSQSVAGEIFENPIGDLITNGETNSIDLLVNALQATTPYSLHRNL